MTHSSTRMAFSVVPWAQVIDWLPLADLLASHA